MVRDVRAACRMDRDAAAFLGVSVGTLRRWLICGRVGDRAARASVWLRWALLLHPETVQTAFDLVTWGRFRTGTRRPGKSSHMIIPQDDYSI